MTGSGKGIVQKIVNWLVFCGNSFSLAFFHKFPKDDPKLNQLMGLIVGNAKT